MSRIARALLVSRTQDVQQGEDEDEGKSKSGSEVRLVHADTREREEKKKVSMRLYGGALAPHWTGSSDSRLRPLPVCPAHCIGCQTHTHTHTKEMIHIRV